MHQNSPFFLLHGDSYDSWVIEFLAPGNLTLQFARVSVASFMLLRGRRSKVGSTGVKLHGYGMNESCVTCFQNFITYGICSCTNTVVSFPYQLWRIGMAASVNE